MTKDFIHIDGQSIIYAMARGTLSEGEASDKIENLINKIFQHFENRTCSTCKEGKCMKEEAGYSDKAYKCERLNGVKRSDFYCKYWKLNE